MPVVVHLSGSPGSGKNYLAETLRGTAGLAIVDTDELIQHHNELGKRLVALGETAPEAGYVREWRAVFGSAIAEAIARVARTSRVVLLVGILNHFGHGNTLDLDRDLPRLPGAVAAPVIAKLFLDVAPATLLQRYYTRLSDIKDRGYWDRVASGDYTITSSSEIVENSAREREWHAEHAYSMVPQEEARRWVELLVTRVLATMT
jgi:hypothetical protein